MHGWYEVIAFLDNDNERKLACWLGPAEDYGGGDAAFLLPKSARPIVRSTFWALTPTDRADQKDEIDDLLRSIDEKIGNDRTNEQVAGELGNKLLPLVDVFEDLYGAEVESLDNTLRRPDADEYTPEVFDKYLTAEIVTSQGAFC